MVKSTIPQPSPNLIPPGWYLLPAHRFTISPHLISVPTWWYLLSAHLLTPCPHPHPHLGGTYSLPVFPHPDLTLTLTHTLTFTPPGDTYSLPIFSHPDLTLTHTWVVLTLCPSSHTQTSPSPSPTPGWYLLSTHLLTPNSHPHPHPHLGGTHPTWVVLTLCPSSHPHPHPHPHLGGTYSLSIFSLPSLPSPTPGWYLLSVHLLTLILTLTHTWVVLTLCPSSHTHPWHHPSPCKSLLFWQSSQYLLHHSTVASLLWKSYNLAFLKYQLGPVT